MTVAYLLLALGLAGIYGEFVRPGSIVPLVVGSVLFILGARQLWTGCHPPVFSTVLIPAAVLLWFLECWLDTRFVASVGASGMLLTAMLLHARHCRTMAVLPLLAIGIAFSLLTTVLAQLGRRARTRKWSDL